MHKVNLTYLAQQLQYLYARKLAVEHSRGLVDLLYNKAFIVPHLRWNYKQSQLRCGHKININA